MDSTWWLGEKLRFNGSPMFNDVFRETGYFQKKHIKLISTKDDLEIYSWYCSRDCSIEIAEKILKRIKFYTSSKENIFMVWSRNVMDYTISVCSSNKCVVHFEVSQNLFDIGDLSEDLTLNSAGFLEKNHSKIEKETPSLVETRFFSIDKRHFRHMVDLINFYGKDFGVSFREVLPRPIYTTMAVDSYQSMHEHDISIKKGNKYFVISEDANKNEYLIFDQVGQVGFMSKKFFKNV